MASRINLHGKLEELLGNKNVYYQPPNTVTMQYPCIRYSKKRPDIKHANDKIYMKTNCYEIIVMDRRPDNPVIDKLLEIPMCSYDRHYTADNLNHDVLTIYY